MNPITSCYLATHIAWLGVLIGLLLIGTVITFRYLMRLLDHITIRGLMRKYGRTYEEALGDLVQIKESAR